ncbi:MAG: DUF3558 family protein, partial [Pseudonocardia sediminis]
DPFPPRPRSIDIQSADPCAGLTGGQRDKLGVDAGTRRDHAPDVPGCYFTTPTQTSFTIQFLRVTGARALLPGYPDQQATDILADPVQEEIDGFGAVRAQLRRGTPSSCSYTVDTGDDSSVQFVYSPLDSSGSPAALAAGCDKAREFASMSLSTLSAG